MIIVINTEQKMTKEVIEQYNYQHFIRTYMGIGMFVILNVLVVINKKFMKGLRKIDKNVNF